MRHCGIDVHSKTSEICVLDETGEVEVRVEVKTSEAGFRRALGGYRELKIAIEASGESHWVGRCLEAQGFDLVVCDPGKVALIAKSKHKSDKRDAEVLARLLRADENLLSATYRRSEEMQQIRVGLKIRKTLVESRTKLSNSIKGMLRGFGIKVKAKPDELVSALETVEIPVSIRQGLAPGLAALQAINEQIEICDAQVEELAATMPAVQHLATIPNVGFLTALYYVSLIEDPKRFWRYRDIAAYLGLVPRHWSSGEVTRRGPITKCGDPEMRRLLVQCAHLTLRNRDTALKRWGLQVMERRGKKTAVVAVARKLSIVMLKLWTTGESYEAFPPQAEKRTSSEA